MNGGVSKVSFESLGTREGESTRFTIVPEFAGRLDAGCFAAGTLGR